MICVSEKAIKTAEKFRDLAVRLEVEIAKKRAQRLDNTPKRAKQAHESRIESNHLERVKIALGYLADAIDEGTLPEELAAIKSKAQLLDHLRTRTASNSYYHVCDTGEFTDQSEIAKSLRLFIESRKTGESRKKEVEELERQKIEELERKIRFADIPGFFPTPRAAIDVMLANADIRPDHKVLEPSAGKGDIADAIRRKVPGVDVRVCEVNYSLREILSAKGYKYFGTDFLQCFPLTGGFDRIVMNPPYERGQDIDHTLHAFKCLAPGGKLVALMSAGPFFRSDSKSLDFRDWLHAIEFRREANVVVFDNPPDLFRGVGVFRETGVQTKTLVIEKISYT